LNIYETDRLLAEYLLFHYASADEILPPCGGAVESALFYPVRCVTECVDATALPANARALDLGCAVGRASFELARYCTEVIGIDFSHRFIDAANTLRDAGVLGFDRTDEGALVTRLTARAPTGIDRTRVRFETGDAMDLRDHLGAFDVVLMANLIDRLSDPRRGLERLPGLVNPGCQLIITSPYTWLEEFTPREKWLGGFERNGAAVNSLDGLQAALTKDFQLVARKDIPFLIREHARKFQWSVAEASIWRRR
jgi:putative 4-mercaptohistidine N1-methyltranferase